MMHVLPFLGWAANLRDAMTGATGAAEALAEAVCIDIDISRAEFPYRVAVGLAAATISGITLWCQSTCL